MSLSDWSSIRIPKELKDSYEKLRILFVKAIMNGKINIDEKLSSVLNPPRCPICRGLFKTVRKLGNSIEIVKCEKCGYAQPRILNYAIKDRAAIELGLMFARLGLGILAGFGLAALASLLVSVIKECDKEFEKYIKEDYAASAEECESC